ncbi:4'-phosphopantetheinyl transferase superfamily protein [uncultured Psychroserpens sp.]|uniref:4'-phosphopantetheinyl transferase family protein n=1 Tax=uncultured Psychroserpens sp. TaxID=255436 RepID=UPI0026206D8E|nr:4'-phosphopantetheinyl transferase superfamily protein [uncultured Psychroserpens sp.]
MIGNDIVDLKHITQTSNWLRPRFLEKIFTRKEQEIILNSENQNQKVWLFWSMKEAAYKSHIRYNNKRFFNPKKFECKLNSKSKGEVLFENTIHHTFSVISKDYIYTIARQDVEHKIESSIIMVDASSYFKQSMLLRDFFLKSISKTKELDLNTLSIRKSQLGVPELFKLTKKLPYVFSFTHCGHYAAFVIC